MRKNLLASVTAGDMPPMAKESRVDYASRGASRSMRISIDEMAESAKLMTAGDAIVAIDPELVDESFISDRLEEDEESYVQLREAIRARGQLTPILVRPHPTATGRYMIVFGRRRTRVARELRLPVRAVVKDIEDIAHIVAQGQENTARADLSFIEKALFARKLLAMGQSKDTIKSALTLDDTLLSRMLSIVEIVPDPVIEAIGAAKSVGRDRWEDLKRTFQRPKKGELAERVIGTGEFQSKLGPERFSYLLEQLKLGPRNSRKSSREAAQSWIPDDKMVAANIRQTGKTFNISLSAKDAGEFGRFISSNLESLYRAFKETKNKTERGV
jgi:ParB family transcriptional regulator, chromosome partitioning protein